MFSMVQTPVSVHKQIHHYTPHVPSPLASSPLRSSPPVSPLEPRNANIPTQRENAGEQAHFGCMMSPSSSPPRGQSPDRNRSLHLQNRRSPSRDNGPYCKRITKTNPLIHGQSDGRETRRKLFLRRVREDSEEQRWKARGGDDEILRTIWTAEQRRRAERQAREAACWAMDEGHEEVDMDLQAFGASLNLDEVMAEEVARKENEELEAILSSMTEADRRQTLDAAYDSVLILDEEIGPTDEMEAASWARGDLQPSLSQHDAMVMDIQRQMNASSPDTTYGSDDGEYDAIFLDVMQDESLLLGSSFQSVTMQTDQEMMDMDMS
ncbi:hypothetical protein CJF32_00010238 [Rutstroemia sp. NJR-2017a WRK4]|nr:hypothetical protein CJF32_00010238 [Rutstroemia sp. NJR-2017a WRK4]